MEALGEEVHVRGGPQKIVGVGGSWGRSEQTWQAAVERGGCRETSSRHPWRAGQRCGRGREEDEGILWRRAPGIEIR